MKYKFGSVNDRIATIQFDFDIDPNTIQRLLEQEQWETNSYSQRSFCKYPKNPRLQNILDGVTAEKFRIELLEHLYSLDHKLDKTFNGGEQGLQWLWNGLTARQIDSICGVGAYFTRDNPGYTTNLHIDRLGHPFVGMIFLNDDNQDFTTDFYSSRDKTDHKTIKHKYCRGWLQANHVDTWHEGMNRSKTQKRYCICFNWGLLSP